MDAQPITNTQGQSAGQNQAPFDCIHCKKQFQPSAYNVRKHYHVCPDCVRARRKVAKVPAQCSAQPFKGAAPAQEQTPEKPVAIRGEHPSKTTQIDASADYVPQNGEVEDLTSNLKSNLNTLLTGPTQCGKTTLCEFVANKTGRELITIQGGAGANFERIVAKDALVEENGVTVTLRPSAKHPSTWSILPQAMDKGAVLYIDEPNSIPNDVLMYLFSAMDYRKTITFDDGTTLKAKDGFVVVCAMNEGAGYSGTSLLNHAFRARCRAIIDMDYLPAKREAALIVDRTGIDLGVATKICEAAQALRDSLKMKSISTPIGTSAVLACGELLSKGAAIGKALTMTIVNQVPSTKATERQAMKDTLAAFFGRVI